MLTALTADYRSAGFEVLERLATVTADSLARFVAATPEVRGGVLLATCNRFEAYLDVEAGADPAAALVAAATAESRVEPGVLRDALTARSGAEVPQHLFAVSSGLESLVVGEAEIAGQVSRALETARAHGSTTPELERLFQRAARTSSAVQQHTRVGSAGRSIVRLALDLAGSRVVDWRTAEVLLIGTGTYAGAALAALRDRGVARIAVYSPSDRALRFARREGVVAVDRADLPARLGGADVVVACSIATTPILAAEHLRRARAAAGAEGRQLIVDLGLPRNIDPDAATVPGVELLDLETIGLHAPLPELQATEEARALVAAAVEAYGEDQRAGAATPAIVAFRAHVFDLVDREVERLRRRGEATEPVERAMRHLAGVLVHEPSARGRRFAVDGDADAFAAAVETVFGLRVAPEAAAAADEQDPLAG